MIQKLKLVWKTTAMMLLTVIMGGCASIICGTSQEVAVNSSPSEATVKVNGMLRGQTPVTLDLKRNKSHTIRIELEGYQPYNVILRRGVNGWVFGNIIFGGLIGLVIDAVDGAIYTIKPNTIQASLLEDKEATVSVNVQKSPKGDLQKIGQMKRLSPAEGQVSSLAEKLKELKKLQEEGYITEQEYNQKKKHLLEEL